MKYMFLIAAFMCLVLSSAFSQDDSTRYINGIPVSDDDTVANFPEHDFAPANNYRALRVDQLPQEVLDALDEGPQYKGWRDTTVYLEINTKLYHVPVRYEEGIRIFGMNENGKPVTYSEVEEREDAFPPDENREEER